MTALALRNFSARKLRALSTALAIFFGVSALLFGLFPFPLLWIGLLVFLIARGAARRRRWAQQGGYSNSASWERNGRYGDSPGWSGHGGCGSRRR